MSQCIKLKLPGSSALSARGAAVKIAPEDTCRCLCGFAAGQGLALGLWRAAGSALGTRGASSAVPSAAGLSPPGLALLPWLSKLCLLALLDQAALHLHLFFLSPSRTSDSMADKDKSVSRSLSGGDQTQPCYWEVACRDSQSAGCSLVSHMLSAAKQIRG